MMRYPRPRKPSNFEETVRAKRAEVQANPNNPTLQFTALWSAFKPVFSEAQGGKCGYCEIAVTGGQDGDVEHYAPKSEVAVLPTNPTMWGEELPNSSRVRGRRPQQLSAAGYWWLAYDWGNYLLACAVCNQKWKGTVFPIREPPPRTLPPAEVVSESSLLLHPFGRADPAVHLRFNEDGSVEPWRSSRRGLETIKTVGLDRPSIRVFRRFPVSDAYQAIRELADARANGNAAAEDRALRDLARLGESGRQFSGCVRAIVRQELGLTWDQVEAAVGG
jgi:hypothetical protein